MKERVLELKRRLMESVKKNRAVGLLFSGGLDSAILARVNSNIKAITVSLKSKGKDTKYASLVARLLNIEHYQKNVDVDEAIDAIPEVVKVLKSFDPAIPNDLVVYFGLKFAKKLGIDEIATGDGSDELFGGYSFMQDMDNLEAYIRKIAEKMHFSSNELGEFFGIRVIQPFIERDIIDFALQIPTDFKIRRYNGKVWGKWVLRKAFEDILPKEIIWQDKRPLEYGSGMRRLRRVISDKVTDDGFRGDFSPVKFINKEHFYYYKVYKKVIGEIPTPKENEKQCPGCGGGMERTSFHCKICGYVLVS